MHVYTMVIGTIIMIEIVMFVDFDDYVPDMPVDRRSADNVRNPFDLKPLCKSN